MTSCTKCDGHGTVFDGGKWTSCPDIRGGSGCHGCDGSGWIDLTMDDGTTDVDDLRCPKCNPKPVCSTCNSTGTVDAGMDMLGSVRCHLETCPYCRLPAIERWRDHYLRKATRARMMGPPCSGCGGSGVVGHGAWARIFGLVDTVFGPCPVCLVPKVAQ